MLSEEHKQDLVAAVRFALQKPGALEYLQQLGPAEIINRMPKEDQNTPKGKVIFDNREEAERIIAGVLGLM